MRETLKSSLQKSEEEIFDYSKIPAPDAVLEGIELPSYAHQDKRRRKLVSVIVLAALVSILGLSLLSPDVRAFVGTLTRKKESIAMLSIEYADYKRFDSVDTGHADGISYTNDDYVILHYFELLENAQYLFYDDSIKLKFVENEYIGIDIQYYVDKTGCIAKFEYGGMLHTIFSDMAEEDFREMLQSMKLLE